MDATTWRELGESRRPEHHVLETLAGGELGAAQETCTMPSLSASAKPRIAATMVCEECS